VGHDLRTDPRDHERRGADRDRLDAERGADRRAAAETEAARERRRQRQEPDVLQRRALRTEPPSKGRALRAGAQVGAQPATLRARQHAVELEGDRALRFAAGQRPFELLSD
jgi:hypothetical protein